MPEMEVRAAAKRGQLWFGLFGGALAWLVHLVGLSVTAEWGGLSGLDERMMGGISVVAWLVLLWTALTAAVALGATWVAVRLRRQMNSRQTSEQTVDDKLANSRFMARTGMLLSGLFLLIIVVETIPVFYYLRETGG